MEQFIGLIVVLVLAMGGSLLKKYLDKQQAEKEAAEQRTKTAASHSRESAESRRQPAPGTSPVRKAIRRKAQRQPTPAPAAAQPIPASALKEVRAMEQRHLEAPQPHQASSIAGVKAHRARRKLRAMLDELGYRREDHA